MTPSTSHSAMLGAFGVIVVLCDPRGFIEAAVTGMISHRGESVRVIRATPHRPTTGRLYVMDHHLAIEVLTDNGQVRPKVLAITDREDGHVLKEAVTVGTIGLLSRHRLTETLPTALARIRLGQPYYDQRLLWATIRAQSRVGDNLSQRRLTAREQEILAGITAGHTTRGMAERLGISVATVRSHVHKVLTKLGVHSRLEAAALVLAKHRRGPRVDDDKTR